MTKTIWAKSTSIQLHAKVWEPLAKPENVNHFNKIREIKDQNFWTGRRCPHFSYFVEIYIFFHLVLPFGSNRRYLHPSGASVNVWTFLIVVFESLSCPRCEKMDLKIIQSLLKRVQICKRCWKREESAGHGGFSWRTVLRLTVQNKQETHEQPSQKSCKKTIVDHPGNHTQY